MYEEQKKTTDALVAENKAIRDELAVVMNSVCDLEKSNAELRAKLDDMDQYSRCSNLKILVVPENHAEDIDSIIQK